MNPSRRSVSRLHPVALATSSLLLTLAGCATVAPEPADTSPSNPTAVIRSETTMTGALLPNAKGTTVTYVRADRRRTANDFQFENWLLRNTLGRMMSGTDEVLRLDRKLQWQLDHKAKSYTECPLTGCPLPAQPSTGADKPSEGQPKPNEPSQDSCKLTVVKNTLKGAQQSDKRNIAGAEAQLYRLTWLVEMKDPAGKKAVNNVTFDFWNTTPSGSLKDALAMQTQFDLQYGKAMAADLVTRTQLNPDVYRALAGLGTSLGPKAENWASTLGKELQKMKGFSMATKVQWTATDNTCGAGEKPAQTTVSSNPLDWITGNTAKPAPAGPLIEFAYEIKQIGLQPERDSRFEVPAKYAKSN